MKHADVFLAYKDLSPQEENDLYESFLLQVDRAPKGHLAKMWQKKLAGKEAVTRWGLWMSLGKILFPALLGVVVSMYASGLASLITWTLCWTPWILLAMFGAYLYLTHGVFIDKMAEIRHRRIGR